ncbi:MAG: hypothetical protein HYR51_00725 [Candidatus Rokubacteria bacterium]|nr:hypothetical protein [Candidatus Rokubacteria bacterium]
MRQDPAATPDVRLAQLRYRMRQGVYNELRSVELIAAWIPHVPEREIRELLPGQLDDEHRHWQLLRRRLIDLGEDPDAYRHAAIGRRAVTMLADTPARQAAARAACREMNERIFGAYRAHRARVDGSHA